MRDGKMPEATRCNHIWRQGSWNYIRVDALKIHPEGYKLEIYLEATRFNHIRRQGSWN